MGLGGEFVGVFFGGHHHHGAVVFGDVPGRHGVDFVEFDAGQLFLHKGKVRFDAHRRSAVDEVAHVLEGQLLRGRFVLFLEAFLGAGEELLLGAVEFGGGEAEFFHPFVFVQHGFQAPLQRARFGHDETLEGVVLADESARVAATELKRRVGLLGEFLEAVAEHGVDQAAHDELAAIGEGALHQPGVFVHQERNGVGLFLVGHDGDLRAGVNGDFEIGPGLGAAGFRDAAELFLDEFLDRVHVEIAHGDDGLQVGAVPGFVEGADGFGLEILEHLLGADHVALAVLAAVHDDREVLVAHPLLGTLAAPEFFQNHAAFLVDFLLVHQLVVGPVFEHVEGPAEYPRRVGGHGEHVHGLVEGGEGVEVVAELDAVFLEKTDEFVLGEILRAVESHVLGEVGEAVFGVVFEHGPHPRGEHEVGAVFGFGVFADVVRQPVGQGAFAGERVEGHGLRQIGGLGQGAQREQKRQRGQHEGAEGTLVHERWLDLENGRMG